MHYQARIHVECGGGTYIRSIARECGEALVIPPGHLDGTCQLQNSKGEFCVGGTLAALERTRNGAFTLSDSVGLEDLEQLVQVCNPAPFARPAGLQRARANSVAVSITSVPAVSTPGDRIGSAPSPIRCSSCKVCASLGDRRDRLHLSRGRCNRVMRCCFPPGRQCRSRVRRIRRPQTVPRSLSSGKAA